MVGVLLAASVAFNAAVWLTSERVDRVISSGRVKEDSADSYMADDDYAGFRRSAHYTRQDIAGVLVAAIVANGLLAAILVLLAFIAYRVA